MTISPKLIEAIAEVRTCCGRLVEYPGQKQNSVRAMLAMSVIEEEVQKMAALVPVVTGMVSE